MVIYPARDAAEQEVGRHGAVAAVGEGVFERGQRQVEDVGEQVEAEEGAGEEGGQEAVQRVDGRVVVGGAEREWRAQAVVPGGVEVRERGGRGGRVQEVAVDRVGEGFADEVAADEVDGDAEGEGQRGGDVQGGREV